MGHFIIPFLGRNHSGSHDVNFLWSENNIYIMDNHLLSLWSWMQHYHGQEPVHLVHVDAHYDTNFICAQRAIACPENIGDLDIDTYLNIEDPLVECDILGEGDVEEDNCHFLFHWSNYMSFFLGKYSHVLDSISFCTHGRGDRPNQDWNICELGFDDLVERLQSDLLQNIILNVDLDYFVDIDENQEIIDMRYRFTRREQLEQLFGEARRLASLDRILVLTICLSPECCGTWRLSEELLEVAVNTLGVSFRLPLP